MLHSSSVDCSSTPTPVCPLSTAKRSYRIPKKSLIVYARNFDEINRKKMTVLCVCVYVYVCVFGDYLGCCRERTGACWGKGLWFS